MSLMLTVPASVPSVFQSSLPLVPSLAVKNNVLPSIKKLEGELSAKTTLMSLMIWGVVIAENDCFLKNLKNPFYLKLQSQRWHEPGCWLLIDLRIRPHKNRVLPARQK